MMNITGRSYFEKRARAKDRRILQPPENSLQQTIHSSSHQRFLSYYL